ncbi:MAG: apolipoprotein N-acyltransferase [Clostridia bacterium]|nr:apolipoprotein N-acyltransferase [Clostridia bacterium]
MTNIKKLGALILRAAESRRTSLLLCLLAGAMGALPYYIETLFIFTFISLFCQFLLLIKQKEVQKRVFKPMLCFYIGFFTPIYLFLSELYPYSNFGFSKVQAIFVLICSCIAIPLLHAFVVACVMGVCSYFKSNAALLFGLPALCVIWEWVLSIGTLALPWASVAVSMTGFLPYLQTASIFGKSFITFITAFGCCGFAISVCRRVKLHAILGASAILFNTVFGVLLWFIPIETNESFAVAAIQGNVLSNEKWDSENNGSIMERYIDMTAEAAKNGADMIILPESAIPQAFVPNGVIHRELTVIAEEYGCTIVAGVHFYDVETKESYNAVIAVLPDGSGTLSERYDKRHLVPFGEFMPFADTLSQILPFIESFNLSRTKLIEGDTPTVIETEYGGVGPLVCFDSIFPQFSSEAVNNGADIIAVVTNDSWFYDSAGTYTHLRHSQLRAIENRRFILRAANTGVTAFINERGEIITKTEPLVKDIAYGNAYTIEDKSVYCVIGDVFLYISFAIIVLIIGIEYLKFVRRSKNGNNSTASE